MHSRVRKHEQDRAEQHVRRAGYKAGGDVAQDREMITKAVHEHEQHDHPGKALTKLRIKRGGAVEGKEPAARLDKRARGGAMRGKPPVNVIVNTAGDPAEKQMAAQQGLQKGIQVGTQLGARAAAQHMAGGPPPGAPMPPGGMPPGAAGPGPGGPPMMPPPGAGPGGPPPGMMPRKRGGAVNLTSGSGGAAGRLEKNKAEGGNAEKPDLVKVKTHMRRKAGGAV